MSLEWTDLGRGLVAGMLERQVVGRGTTVRWVGVALIVMGVVAAIGFGGFLRGLAILFALIGLSIVLLVGLVRKLALAAIRRFATPTSLAEKRDVIDRAMDDADLPTGPISILRFLSRVRRGVGSEVRRLDAVLDDLRDELAMSEELLRLQEADAAGELEDPATPELPE